MVVIFIVGVCGKAMAQQAFANSVVKVRNFPVIVFAADNVHNFPQRGPVLVSEDDVTGVYNETTKTMTLTYPQPPHRRAQARRICRFVCGQRPHL